MIFRIGTPETDAFRRDITINALFYNIETGKIEDYVGGISDLKNKIIRTPLDPIQTFKDDPLRILRALRFLSKLDGFTISPEIIAAIKNPEVQNDYKNKVSSERSGPEIIKLMRGKNPVPSIRILFETNLYKNVFNVPEMQDINEEGIQMEQKTPYHKYNLMEHTLEVIKNLNNIMIKNNETDEMRGLMNLSALFHDFGKMKKNIQKPHEKNINQMQYIGHEKESEKMTDAILNSIGGITKDQKDIVKQIVGLHMYPHEANQWGTSGKAKFLRKTMLPGKEKEHKDLWKYVFYHTQADQMASQPDKYDQEKQNEIFNNFKNYVEKPSIQHNLLINGNEVKNIIQEGLVNKIKDGPWLGQVINQIRYLQDEEIIKTKEDAITKIKEMKPEILNIYNKQNNIIISFNWYKKIN